MDKEIVWTNKANTDLHNVFLKLLEKTKSIEITSKVISEVYSSVLILSKNPEIFKLDNLKRNNQGKDDAHYVKATKGFTLLWGVLAIIVACTASLFENLIELVNIIGSIFYGNILGIFLLAFFFKYVKGNAVFVSALITQVIITVTYLLIHFGIIEFPYLWLNAIGSGLVIGIAFLLQASFPNKQKPYEQSLI